jgi:enoyl-CoA hydratase
VACRGEPKGKNRTPSLLRFSRMSENPVLFEVADRIATITVNRPEKLNALNDRTIALIGDAVHEARERADVGGIILTGAGRAFVAGADIGELQRQSPAEAKERALRGQAVFRLFETSPKATIAAVNGFALGGGCELAMSCHMRVASTSAKFGQPEVKLGTVPGYGATQRLPRLVGRGRALKLLLSGDPIDAAEAYRIGLVNAVHQPEELLAATRQLLGTIISQGPVSVALCIEAVDRGLDMRLEEGLALEAEFFGRCAATDDMAEGMRAFLEKRPAAFTGS